MNHAAVDDGGSPTMTRRRLLGSAAAVPIEFNVRERP
jgi:hypothetical protein